MNTPGGVWRSLVDTYSLKAQEASLTLLYKLDSVRIGTNDDPTLKLLEMDDNARSLRSSHSQGQHLTQSYVIGKFVNALPREYDIQKQMLGEREDGFSGEAVVSLVQKRSDSSTYKQLRRSKSKLGEDQASAVTGGGKNTPDAVDLATAVESQVDHRSAVETAARAAEVPRVEELAAAAVAPRPRSPRRGRPGCARATSITFVTAPNRSTRSVARGALHN